MRSSGYNRLAMGTKDGPEREKRPVRKGEGPRKAAVPARSFETYEAALDYLMGRVNVERARPERVDREIFKLDRMRAMLAEMSDPQNSVKFVHVAGSKGKGSVCEMVAACLSACGYTTGLYTSPHLVDIRERIRIGSHVIPYADFVSCLARAATAADAVEKDHGEATYFELLTALALAYFQEQAIDVAVMEVGLGGRLDSTNVITPEVTAVTAIQLEHTQLLGDTLELIASEKAGIFKPGVPALTIPQQKPEVIEALRAAATQAGAPFMVLGADIDFNYRFEASRELGPHVRVCLTTPRSNFEHLPVPLKGEHQAFNCGLALAILDALRTRGFETPERLVTQGLSRTPNPGRIELISSTPRIVVDGAHNPESIHALMRSLGAHLKYDSLVVIFGCAQDKNIPGMLAKLALGADKVIFTKASGTPRAADPRDLQRKFIEVASNNKMTQVAATLKDALNIAARAVARDDMICVTGSFYLAGEAKKLLIDKSRREQEPTAEIEPKPDTKSSTRA